MLVLLFQWFAAHFFADFLLQSKKLIQNKKTNSSETFYQQMFYQEMKFC